MKKLLITLSILVLLGMILPGLPILAQTGKTPHENPAKATGSFNSAGLLLSYSQIAGQAINSQYQSAREILNELDKVDIPDDFRYIINQYNALNHNLFTTLDNLETLLDEITDLLARNRIDEAHQYLDSSERLIQDADYLLRDTEAATHSLSEKLGALAASASDRLSQAYNQLEVSIGRLADLIERYKSIRKGLDERYTRMTGLTPTTLSLSITPEAAFVGDSVTATGSLKSADGLLAGKTISINTGDITVGTAITGINGSYAASVSVPLEYLDNMIFTALYEPSEEDAGVFLASRSQSVTLSAKFYPSRLETDLPARVYRGLPFTINGEVSTDDTVITRYVNVFLDDRPLAEATVSGRFSLEVTAPPDAMPGRRNLKIAVTPEGRYSGVEKKQGINLVATTLRIETQTPAIVLLPTSIDISGTVSSGPGPLADTPVVLTLMNSSTTVMTAPDGSFTGSIKLRALPAHAPLATNPFSISASSGKIPHDLSPINSHNLQITAEIPGYASLTSTVKRPVVTINPLSSGLTLVLIFTAVLVLYRKKQTKTMPETAKTSPESAGLTVKVTGPVPVSLAASNFTGIKGRVLSAYRSGLAAVEYITGIIMTPSATLREFLKTARLPSPSAAARFAELTAITESSLYAAGDPPDIIADRAEELVDIIKEDLHHGNP